MKIGCNMTQRIFKKSNKQDMIDLFNILPDEVQYIERTESCDDVEVLLCTKISTSKNVTIITLYKRFNYKDIFNIDFEENSSTEFIERPKEDNDK